MEVIFKPKGAGKSTDLIKKSAETGTYIVVVDRKRALHLRDMAASMGLHIPFPITFAECISQSGWKGSYIRKVYIDDADDFIQHFFNKCTGGKVQVDTITMRGE